jgi:hypothetical protein
MNGTEIPARIVTARLPSGIPIRVELAEQDSGDGIASVGLRDFNFDTVLTSVAEIGSAIVEKLKKAKPVKTTVELRLGFTVEAGKLTALWVGGKGEAALTVTLEWSEHPAASEDA